MEKSPSLKSYRVTTDDGWKIALHRYPHENRDRSPVFMVHGLASNRHNFDFPQKERSLAKYLWNLGWDVWIVELRGAGHSTKPRIWEWMTKRWNFDHYVLNDLPAAVSFVLKESGHAKLHWIGHSMGGILVYPFLKTQGDQNIKSITTAASPLTVDHKPGYFKWTTPLDPLFKVVPLMPYRTLAELIRLNADWLYKLRKPMLFEKENMDVETIRIGTRIAIDDVSSDVIIQMHKWLRNRQFESNDGSIDYTLDLKKLRTPILLVTGTTDPFTPHRKVRLAFKEIGSKKKEWMVFGKKHGHATNYGHLDLIIGKNAYKEVYPIIGNWLSQNEVEKKRKTGKGKRKKVRNKKLD
jgi:pimeloyl-ACP methyl ester carboxylesterase